MDTQAWHARSVESALAGLDSGAAGLTSAEARRRLASHGPNSLPLLPLQILWLNLVTDVFPALALAMEPAEPDVMRRPPADPSGAILSRRFSVAVTLYSLLMAVPVLGVFAWGLAGGDEQRAGSLAFLALAFGQILHAFNARGRGPVLLRRALWENGWMWAAVGLCTVLTLVAVYVEPLARVMRLKPVGGSDLVVVFVVALIPLVAGQLLKGRHATKMRSSPGARSVSCSGPTCSG